MGKSPGVYFSVIDNTSYETAQSVIGTTVAIVGFAKKGPIGTPTEITTYKSFKETFGGAVDGYYSDMAVKNILTAGGKVLFVRVADETAMPSNVIMKKSQDAIPAKSFFNRNSNIQVGDTDYSNSKTYQLELKRGSGDSALTKRFYINSPYTGVFRQTNILSQIQNQLGVTSPKFILKRKESSISGGTYSFAVKATNGNTTKEAGPFIMKTTTGMSINSFIGGVEGVSGIGDVLLKDPVQTIGLKLSKCKLYNSNFEIAQGLEDKVTVGFSLWKDQGTTGVPVTANVKLYTNTEGTIKWITYEEFVDAINETSATTGISASYIENTALSENEDAGCFITFMIDASDTNTYAKIKGLDLSIESGHSDKNEAFVAVDGDATGEFRTVATTPDGSATVVKETTDTTYTKIYTKTDSIAASTKVAVNSDINAIEFTTEDSSISGDGWTLSIVSASDYKTGYTFIFDTTSGCKVNDGAGVTQAGTASIADKIKVYRDSSTNKITFESIDASTDSIEFTKTSVTTLSDNLLKLMKDPIAVSLTDEGYTAQEAQEAELATANDYVVITTKESGSATNNVSVTFASASKPTSTGSETVNTITVSVDGTLTETFSDVSYNPNDTNYFVNKINVLPEEGGSSYITVKVVKHSSRTAIDIVEGTYQPGLPITSASIKRSGNTQITDYDDYDYSEGIDGIPTSASEDLFEEALDAENSELANVDLYSFHILITPDNISESVQNAGIELCSTRGDAIVLVDPPVGLTKEAVANWHNGKFQRGSLLNSEFAATYWPWLKVYDSEKLKYSWIMPSVLMAAKYCEVDNNYGCWHAPAGEVKGIMNSIDIETNTRVKDRDYLYTDYNRVNPFVKLANGNVICYGEKTTYRNDTALNKIHTNRMLFQIKKESKEALRKYIFMPLSNEYLGKISDKLTSIMEKYKIGGGVTSYKVVCDSSNNTDESLIQGIVNVDVAMVPANCIEVININLTLNKSDSSVTVA